MTVAQNTVGNLQYYFELSDHTAHVTGVADNISGTLVIPSSVSFDGETYVVTAVDGLGGSDITSVVFPNTVNYIGSGAFSNTSLTSLTISNPVHIGFGAFSGCGSLTSVCINANVSTDDIGSGPFANCENLTSFTFGNSVKTIPDFLLDGITGVTSITIPDSVTYIGSFAFYGCSNLSSVTFNAENCYVGGYPHLINGRYLSEAEPPAFFRLKNSITNFIIGNNVKTIPAFLCFGLNRLTSVTIPESVGSISCGAFANCDSLTNVFFNADSCFYSPYYYTSLEDYQSGYGSLQGPNPFSANVGNFVFGDNVKIIPDHLCDGLNGLTSITIPDSVNEIGAYAFRGCGLASVIFPNSLRSINSRSFASTDIASLAIPSSVMYISYDAFRNCNNLSSIEIDEGNTVYDSRDTCNAIIRTSDNSLMLGCMTTTIPNSVTNIDECAFYECGGLTSITIPGSVNSFGYYTFYGCDSLTNVYMLGNYPPEILLESYYLEEQIFHNDVTVHIPCNSINNYLSAYSRGDYGNYYYMWRRCNLIDPCSINRTITIVNNGGGYMQYRIGDNSFQDATDTVTVTVLDSSELRLRLYTILSGTEAAAEFGLSSRLMRLLVNGAAFPLNSETCEIRDYSNDGGYIQYRVNMVVDTDMTIEAVYVPYINATVSALASDSTLGSVTGGGTCYHFDEVVLSACASVGSTFLGWSNGSTQNPLTLEVMSDTTLVAYFTSGNSADTIFIHIHDTTYIDMPYAVHDTTIIDIHDTTYVNVPHAVHDTTYIDVYVHDTTTIIDTLTLIEYMTVHDTTYIDVHDTTYIDVPYAVHDTTYITLTDTVINTIYDTITNTVYDTVTNTVYDTIDNFVYDTLTVTDTLWLTQIDTLWLRDTVIIHDTIYITQEGIDGVEAMNAKVYSSNGQIVVDGAAGNTVWLYDINGRVLATKRDENTPLCFDAPASGTYLIKIGGHPARKVVVIR